MERTPLALLASQNDEPRWILFDKELPSRFHVEVQKFFMQLKRLRDHLTFLC